jgi:hypothetical protein
MTKLQGLPHWRFEVNVVSASLYKGKAVPNAFCF